ncbi:MAG TPA: bifunctional aspartate kinase/homoserine dehydrogenase I [Steroidobacteraceae bacterium]|nr:bifunctional aspartate kinase/homoserine dehydrogenase I [Steroidobacteraceae bacterium]
MTRPSSKATDRRWIVHKFGGSSVADAECVARVAGIVESTPDPRVAVVLSAHKGVTDTLLELVALAEAQNPAYLQKLAALRDRHTAIANALLPRAVSANPHIAQLEADCADIAGILHTVSLIRSAAHNIRDLVAGYGEIWSTRLFARLLAERGKSAPPVLWVDARKAVVVEWGPLGPAVQWPASKAALAGVVPADFSGTLVITGFIASKKNGVQTTLGRNGSDFSASIFGALLDAREIVIWTDVDGVLSADPRRVPDAKVIDSLSYSEAMELAYFGAKVIHPQTMAPAVSREIPILIKNTFAAERPGTLICARPNSSLKVKGITTIDAVALVNLEGAGMIGVPGTAQRLFGALNDAGISVILISQGSSEHSICCAVPDREARAAEEIVRRAFDSELREGQIQRVEVSKDCAILAVVGDGMAGTHGIAAKVFGTLAAAGVNVRAIAQGASERNISVVIEAKHSTRALRAVHAGFYLSPHTLSIGIIGRGHVAGALLGQLASQLERLRGSARLDLRVRGILASRQMLLADGEIDPGHWREAFERGAKPADVAQFVRHVHAEHLPHAVIIDCSANAEIAAHYKSWLAAGIHVVTPNKKANSGTLEYYESLKEARREGGTHYLYEATVGAGLPVIQTLWDLRETGDEVRSIEGIFSGTLAYLFNVYDGTTPFSAIVREAKRKGYTEPDPRDDLSGTDVARKLIILGREIGLKLELSDVEVESLVPPALAKCGVEEFLNRLHEFDAAIETPYAEATRTGQVLRYVGRLDASGKATVGLVRLDRRHPFANIALTDNVVRFETRRYCDNPLIVQGPGAGPEVTAGGVFGDLLRLCAYLGARI